MNTEEERDSVTRVLDSLCEDLKGRAKVPNPHILTLAMKKLFGFKLWMPEGNIFEVRKTSPVSWGTKESILDERQNTAKVSRLEKKLSSYL